MDRADGVIRGKAECGDVMGQRAIDFTQFFGQREKEIKEPIKRECRDRLDINMAGASEARGGSAPTDPITMWLSGGLSLSEDGQTVDPLKWWMQQRRAGNTHGGLLEMALDVLSCPGKSFLYLILSLLSY